MAFISNEVPTGAINGVNTTFTTATTIYQAIVITIDGSIYTGTVAALGTSFIVADAPSVSITISYYNSPNPGSISTAVTLSDARTEFLQRKKDISDIDNIANTFLKWCNYVNRYAYEKFTNIMPEQYIETQVYTTVSGTSTYALPSDFQNILPQGTGMYKVGSDGVATDSRLAPTGYASSKTGFYITNTSIIFTPIPSKTDTWNFRYIPLLDDMSTDASQFVIPRRFSKYIMDALDQCYNIWDEDNNAEIFNDERFINSMSEMLKLINPAGQAYSIPDYSSLY